VEKFMHEENLFIKIDENESKKLQKLFEEVCRGYNKSKYILILLNEGQDSRYRSNFSFSFFFVVVQHNNPHLRGVRVHVSISRGKHHTLYFTVLHRTLMYFNVL
jgi:hypothetical protein